MSGRSSMMIVLIGVGAMLAMGFMVKFVFDNQPNLVRIGEVKQAFAAEYGEAGLDTVSVRTLPKRRGYSVHARVDSVPGGDADSYADEIARFFVAEFEGQPRYIVEVHVVRVASTFDCEGDQTLLVKKFQTNRLKRRLELEEGLAATRGQRHEELGLVVVGSEVVDDETVRMVLEPPETAAPLDLEAVEPARLSLKSFAFRVLSRVPVRRVQMVVRSSSGRDAAVKELSFERENIHIPRRRAGAR